MIKLMYVFIGLALIAAVVSVFLAGRAIAPAPEEPVEVPVAVMCTADALQCPDGSYVGRSGPDCSFVCPQVAESSEDMSDLIVVDSPEPLSLITSPAPITGSARGIWFFEASFPVTLKNSAGAVIAQAPATATSDWMTTDFVPFTLNLTFINPYTPGDPEEMKFGTLILERDNPSDLPENDAMIEIPVRFAP